MGTQVEHEGPVQGEPTGLGSKHVYTQIPPVTSGTGVPQQLPEEVSVTI